MWCGVGKYISKMCFAKHMGATIARLRYSQWAHQEYVKEGRSHQLEATGVLAMQSHELEALARRLPDRTTLDTLYEKYVKLRGERTHACH